MTKVNERHGQCYPLPFLPSTNSVTLLSVALLIKILLVIGGIEINPGPNNRPFYKNIKIVHNNVCSILPKVDIVFNELSDYDFIGITESHLDSKVTNEQIEFDGFQMPIRLDRNRHGGGVALYIRNSLHYKSRSDLLNPNIEIIFVEIQNVNNKFLLSLIYRPPNSKADFLEQLAACLEKALDTEMPIFLMGDFNIDMLAEGNNTFRQLLHNFSLTNIINQSTNFTTSRGTCIDLIVTNSNEMVEMVEILTPFCSTHSPTAAELQFKTYKQRAYRRIVTNYSQANYHQLNTNLSELDWDNEVFTTSNINEVYSNFTKVLKSLIDKSIPRKTIVIRPSDKPFMNNAIKRKMRQRNRVHYKAKVTQSNYQWSKYRTLRNEVIDMVRKAKNKYKQKITSQIHDKSIPPGKWWRIVLKISNQMYKKV